MLVKLLEPVLELSKIVDLILQQLDLILLLHSTAHPSVLELAHLVHARHDLLLRLVILLGLRHVFGFVDDFDRGNVCAI